jgi:hypothetical protein
MGDPFTLQDVIERCDNIAARGINTADIIYQQFIGISDRNGKDIFEGDVLKIDYQDGPLIGFGRHPAHFSPFASTDEPLVIGNIYENPELLKS